MNKKLVFNLLGKILLLEAVMMLLPLVVALIYGGQGAMPFVFSILITGAASAILLLLIKSKDDNLRPREGFLTVALAWVALSLFGSLPFYLGGYIPSFVDCLFESVSGFSTTGASLLPNVEVLPNSIMFWRSLTQWIGGMGVLVLSLALLPKMGARSLNLLKAETTGPTPGKLVPRIANTARIMYWIYFGLTLAAAITYWLCGMNPFDALLHALSTAGTGGFSNYNASIGHFNSPALEWAVTVFMTLFGINFTMFFLLLHKNLRDVLKNQELQCYLGILVVASLAITFNLLPGSASFAEALRTGFFHVSAMLSTAGFVTGDFNLWPQFSRMLMVLLMFIGASAGSTSGGIKIVRIQMIFKAALRELRRLINPRNVQVIKIEGRAIEETVLVRVLLFFAMYITLIGLCSLLISVDGFDIQTNFTAALAATSNIGFGLGEVSPAGSFAGYSPFSKIILMFCMVAGRLELYPMLMLFSFSAWKKN